MGTAYWQQQMHGCALLLPSSLHAAIVTRNVAPHAALGSSIRSAHTAVHHPCHFVPQDQEEMKLTLLLNVIDPNIGGVLIMGDRGTAKSVAVSAVQGCGRQGCSKQGGE